MQGKRILLAMMGGFSALITVPAQAFLSIPGSMSVPCGWYVEANIGSGHVSEKNYPIDSSSSGLAGNANLGYKFMPYFAIEGGYSQFSDTQLTAFDTDVSKDKHYAYGLWAKGIVPIIDSGFELFAKVGGARNVSNMTIQDTTLAQFFGIGGGRHSTTGLYMGIGGQYYFMPELAVVAQWQRAKGNSETGTLDLYSIGLSFIFT